MYKIRYKELDIIKGVCILLVFFQHSILYFPINFSAIFPACQKLSHIISSFFMPCFFVVSGFLFYYNKKTADIILKDKINRLVLPYMVVCLIQLIVKLFVPTIAFGKFDTFTDYICYYLFAGGDRWFLYVLFLIFLVFIPLKVHMNNTKNIMTCICLFYFLYVLYISFFPYIYPIQKILIYGVYFAWGFLLRKYYDKVRKHLKNSMLLYSILFLIFNLLFTDEFMYGYLHLIQPLTGTLWLFSIVLYLMDNRNRIMEKWHSIVSYFGRYSLQYYIMTGFVLTPARIIMVTILHQESPLIVIPCVFVIQMCFAVMGVKLFERFSITRRLFGY